MPIGIMCVKLLELRVGSSRRSSGTALKWWLLDPSPALNSILTLSLLSHICPGHQPRCTIPVNPFKLFEASGREQDVNVSCCEISFIFLPTLIFAKSKIHRLGCASDHLAWALYLGGGTYILDSMVRPVVLCSTYLFKLEPNARTPV